MDLLHNFYHLQQFVKGTFESAYYPTSKKEIYYPSVVHHDRKYNLKIVDIPDVPFFPVSSFYNLSDLKGTSNTILVGFTGAG